MPSESAATGPSTVYTSPLLAGAVCMIASATREWFYEPNDRFPALKSNTRLGPGRKLMYLWTPKP